MLKHKLDKTKSIYNFRSNSCVIISSTDHPYALSDIFKICFRETSKYLFISTPYFSKSFIDMHIRILKKGTEIRLITKVPDEQRDYRTIRAIESLITVARELELKLDVMCKPFLHLKFIVFDNKIVLSGSVNPTSSGVYDNDEILYVFANPLEVDKHIEIFDKLWYCPRNTSWENLRKYYDIRHRGNFYSIRKKIAEVIIGFFHLKGNQAVPKSVLCEKIARRGFGKNDVIETIKVLLNEGALYEPKPDLLKLTNYQMNINDF